MNYFKNVCLLLVVMLAVALLPTYVHAATITVDTTDDELTVDGDCSLREAVQSINDGADYDACGGTGYGTDDTINVPASVTPYVLDITSTDEDANADGDVDILTSVIITGAGAKDTIIDGASDDRVFEILGSASNVTISNITIQNGSDVTVGGGGNPSLNQFPFNA